MRFLANHASICSICGEDIVPEEEIERDDDDNGWAHVECVEDDRDFRPTYDE